MEYLQKCFYKSTNWNEDNIYSNITATSQALLEFPIPNGCKVDISSKATDHSASSFTLSNYRSVNGSLAYLYSSTALKNTMGTKDVSLQDAIAGFRITEPAFARAFPGSHASKNPDINDKGTVLYGRMYFPGSALEAMMIKRISQTTQLLVKCVNNPHLAKNGTLVVYLQKNTPKYSRELVYSTNEALFGFRCLYNFGANKEKQQYSPLIPKFDNSVISVGTEIWYAAFSMSPGLSTALRYSTRSTSTGKPLTMTLSCNPILGHIQSTYSVKTSVSSTFSSKYDFNIFSYASNLSLGFEFYNYSKSRSPQLFTSHAEDNRPHHDDLKATYNSGEIDDKSLREGQPIPIGTPTHLAYRNSPQNIIINPIQNLDNYYHINPNLLPTSRPEGAQAKRQQRFNHKVSNETVMTAFQNLVNDSDFSSVFKTSTSLSDKMVKILWEGRCKDFLVSTGVKINLNSVTNFPEVNRFGISFSYAC